MKKKWRYVVVAFLIFDFSHEKMIGAEEAPGPVIPAMQKELARTIKEYPQDKESPLYFLSYRITDKDEFSLSASPGALGDGKRQRERILQVDLRVGSYQFDNSHQKRRGQFDFDLGRLMNQSVAIPLDDNEGAIRSVIWQETDRQFKKASEVFIKLKTDQAVSVKEEDQSADLSRENQQHYIESLKSFNPALPEWRKRLKKYADIFLEYPDIYSASINVRGTAENKFFVNSEGTVIQQGRINWRISFYARTKAEDGQDLNKYYSQDAGDEKDLPADSVIETEARKLCEDLLALRKAPLMEPFAGPAILSGRAAGVFFHEIFGHRIEGHRQKLENEGTDFTKKINEKVLPDFLSVIDDPTLTNWKQAYLNGHYQYDDEGMKAQKVELVKKGILKGFLMSRSAIEGFSKSNGHGRAQADKKPVSRQGNLIIQSSRPVPVKKLRQLLLEECKKQGKPYGLLFDDITGGFTITGRFLPNAFNVTPITVYRVYTDGRPDELVRGVDLIGTPLTSFSKILSCSDQEGIFNGFCGAESGSVPVSGVCPDILTGQVEVQKKMKDTDKPPVLPPPERGK